MFSTGAKKVPPPKQEAGGAAGTLSLRRAAEGADKEPRGQAGDAATEGGRGELSCVVEGLRLGKQPLAQDLL